VTRIRAAAAVALLAMSSASWGQTLDQFLRAVTAGETSAATKLLDKGVDPDSADDSGNTVLMIAARQGDANMVSLLIRYKATVARRSAHGDTALNLAAFSGHLEVVKLLVEHGAELAPTTGWGPLHYAAFENKAEVVKYLIQKGAPKDALAPNGYTALMLAARGGHLEAATALLYEDADLGIKAPGGETALSIATAKRNEEMVKLLKRAGAAN